MQSEIRILFTSIGRRVELVQAFRNAAEELGQKVKLYGADISDTAPALAFCDAQVKTCRISHEDYISTLLEICCQEKIDILIPTIDTDLLVLAGNIELFQAQGTKVLISSYEFVSCCRDKRKTATLFEKSGLSAPKVFTDVREYNMDFPAFIKPLDGSSSINAYKADNFEELQEYAMKIENYIVQPFIDGTEYTIDAMCDFEGKPIFITPRERVAVRSGEVLKTKITQDSQMIGEGKRLIDMFKPAGPITIQLIRTKERKDYFIEINPRFGGGAPLSMKAGADAAKAVIMLSQGKRISFVDNAAADGKIYSRFDQSICVNKVNSFCVEKVVDAENICMKYKAAVFDLDDTLYSEKQYVKSGYQRIADRIFHDQKIYVQLWDAFIRGEQAIDVVLEENGMFSEEMKRKCLSIYRNQTPDISLYEGVSEMLTKLREKNIKIGLITDGRPYGQSKKIRSLGLKKLVDEVIITDELAGNGDVTFFRKPNTIAFEIMRKRLNVAFDDMIYIGDNYEKDVTAAKRFGIDCVHVDNADGLYRRNRE